MKAILIFIGLIKMNEVKINLRNRQPNFILLCLPSTNFSTRLSVYFASCCSKIPIFQKAKNVFNH